MVGRLRAFQFSFHPLTMLKEHFQFPASADLSKAERWPRAQSLQPTPNALFRYKNAVVDSFILFLTSPCICGK